MIFAGSKNFSGHIREFWCSDGVTMFKKKNSIDAKNKPKPPPKKKTGALAWFAKAAGDIKSKAEALKKHKMGALTAIAETPDEEYMAASAVFLAIEKCMKSLREATNHFEQTIARYFESLETCGEHFAASSLSGPEQREERAFMTQCIFEQQNQHRAKVTSVLRERILDPLDAKLAQMADVKAEMEARKIHKKEYDYYFEKLRRLRLKDGDKNQEKIDRNEPKLEEAKDQLNKSSQPLIALFLKYESIRSGIVASEFEMFKQCQHEFFHVGNEVFAKLDVKEVDLVQLPTLSDMSHLSPKTAAAVGMEDEPEAAAAAVAMGHDDYGEHSSDSENDDDYDNKKDLDHDDDDDDSDQDDAGAGGGGAAAPETTAAHHSSSDDEEEPAHDEPKETETTDANETAPPIPDEEPQQEEAEQDVGEGAPAVALFDFEPSAEDELRLTAGQELIVLVQNEGGWWEGEIEGEIGLFPSNYVKLL